MDEVKRVAIAYYEYFNARKMDELEALVDENFVGHGLGGAGGATAFRKDSEAFLTPFPDLHLTIEDVIAEDDRVAVKTTMRGTHRAPIFGVPASGNPIEVGGCDVFRVRAGKIVEAWMLGDSGTLFMQIGAFQPTAAR